MSVFSLGSIDSFLTYLLPACDQFSLCKWLRWGLWDCKQTQQYFHTPNYRVPVFHPNGWLLLFFFPSADCMYNRLQSDQSQSQSPHRFRLHIKIPSSKFLMRLLAICLSVRPTIHPSIYCMDLLPGLPVWCLRCLRRDQGQMLEPP